ncbi:hypothetical protein ACFWZ2_20270 [Streptomyces sp. NPDC059002]|uniref:hypothetical protein n=1 Tax=Streptomyces sp. NPDC059002 TaxID=3346690 RepID=UPI0036988E9A
MRTKTRTNWKLCLLGATAALALATTACEPSGGDDNSGDAKPSATASHSTDTPSNSTDTPSKPDAPDKPGGDWDYADRQKPPTVNICDAPKQDQYGKIESVNMGGESPYPVIGTVLGSYDCDDEGPHFSSSSATGAASDLLVDSNHLKVVVGGTLAEELGTRTPDANTFLDKIADMQDKGELDGGKGPEFYIAHDAETADSVPVGDDVHVIYLYQIIDGE